MSTSNNAPRYQTLLPSGSVRDRKTDINYRLYEPALALRLSEELNRSSLPWRFLEEDRSGQPFYVHHPRCEGGCDYQCRPNNEGFDMAELFKEVPNVRS